MIKSWGKTNCNIFFDRLQISFCILSGFTVCAALDILIQLNWSSIYRLQSSIFQGFCQVVFVCFICFFFDWSLALANLNCFLSVVCVLHLYSVTNYMPNFMNCASCASSVYLGRIEYLFIMIINVCPLVSILPEIIL